MPRYEYKVVPAPTKGRKGKGIKGAEARFSNALQDLMNGLAGYGWEYLRAETLPSIERSGLTSTTTEWRNVLIFRRPRRADTEDFAPELLPAPEEDAVPTDALEEPQADVAKPSDATPVQPQTSDAAIDESTREQAWDNGVEDTSDVRDIGASLGKLAATRKPTDSSG